jgi:hypothetical protein
MIDEDVVNVIGMVYEEDVFEAYSKTAHVAISACQSGHETKRVATTLFN